MFFSSATIGWYLISPFILLLSIIILLSWVKCTPSVLTVSSSSPFAILSAIIFLSLSTILLIKPWIKFKYSCDPLIVFLSLIVPPVSTWYGLFPVLNTNVAVQSRLPLLQFMSATLPWWIIALFTSFKTFSSNITKFSRLPVNNPTESVILPSGLTIEVKWENKSKFE